MKILLYFFIIAVLWDLTTMYMSMQNINNIWLFNIFILIDYSFLIIVFSYWQKSPKLKRAFRLSIPLFILIWFGAKIFQIESFDQLNIFSRSIEGLIFMVISVNTLSELGDERGGIRFYRDHRFWISSGVLVYFVSNLLIIGLTGMDKGIVVTWWIHAIANIMANLCYSAGFLFSHSLLDLRVLADKQLSR